MKDVCCYILHSEKLSRFYIGACQQSLPLRIQKHNTAFYGMKHFSARTSDWVLFLRIDAVDYPHALRIERKIKAMKSAVFIQNLKRFPELIIKIKNETSLYLQP